MMKISLAYQKKKEDIDSNEKRIMQCLVCSQVLQFLGFKSSFG